MLKSIGMRLFIAFATFVDRRIRWHCKGLPEWFALFVLFGARSRLRRDNLYHTSLGLPRSDTSPPTPACRRTADGTFNDLKYPSMGSAGTPFGRNASPAVTRADGAGPDGRATSPNPREVSERLLKRVGSGERVNQLNMLAAAWIQFMVHDWFSHGPTGAPNSTDQIEIPLAAGDSWPQPSMKVPRTLADPTRPGCSVMPATHLNTVTHWWDGSQLYGSDRATQALVRDATPTCLHAPAGKLRIEMADTKPWLPADPVDPRSEVAGFRDNWWLDLSLMHTLFALEHNAICDHLRAAYPTWSEEDLFGRARLINAALMAKIHTLEWTPAMLDHPVVHRGMRGVWQGLDKEGWIYRLGGRIFGREVRYGVPGSPTIDHHGVPYSITEEFVSVYRMHTLLPDTLTLKAIDNRQPDMELKLEDVVLKSARDVLKSGGFSVEDALYSFALMSPGMITLHNYPNALRQLTLNNGLLLDLAAVDILRDRERGVPRYNAFREVVHLPRVSSFEELVGKEGADKGRAQELREVYGNVDAVDLMVGLFAEPKPDGFGFGDTAFRIFLFMASRRLQSDRFFTTDYNEKVYTPEGMAWIEKTNMEAVLRRHFPQLAGVLDTLKPAKIFGPWVPPAPEGGAP